MHDDFYGHPGRSGILPKLREVVKGQIPIFVSSPLGCNTAAVLFSTSCAGTHPQALNDHDLLPQATCAGLIMLAERAVGEKVPPLRSLLDPLRHVPRDFPTEFHAGDTDCHLTG